MQIKLYSQPIIFIIIGLLIFSTKIEAKSFQSLERNTESTDFLKSIKDKWTKKIKQRFVKKQYQNKGEKIKTGAKWAYFLGLGSLFLLGIGFFLIYLLGYMATVSTICFLIALIAAVVGGVWSIIILRKIKKSADSSEYNKSKNLAKSGLIFSLLTGLIPIVVLISILMSI